MLDYLTPESALNWNLPSDPRITGDGRRAAYVLAPVSHYEDQKKSAIRVVELQSGVDRQYTSGMYEDRAPRWSPDGEKLAFLSDRTDRGQHQLYLMRSTGGEPRVLAECKGGITAPTWSPNGCFLAFIAKDPEPDGSKAAKEERRDAVVADEQFRFRRLWVIPADGGSPRQVSPDGDIHVVDYTWSPDSRSLVLAITAESSTDSEMYGPTRLMLIDTQDAADPKILLTVQAGIEQPRWSPDGQTIAYRSKSGRVQADDAVWIIPARGGNARQLMPGCEGSVSEMSWSAHDGSICFVGYEDLQGVICEVHPHTGEMLRLIRDGSAQRGTYAGLSVDDTGGTFVVIRSASDEPWNLWMGQRGKSLRQVTGLNVDLSSLPYANGESISWLSSDGLRISGLLFRPLGFSADIQYPLVVEVHGGPASLWSDRFFGNWHDWAQLLATRGFAVLLPNPRGSLGRGAAFADAEVDDMGGMEFEDIMTGLDHVLTLGFVDERRVGIGGWSHGGYLSAWAITQTDRFRAAVVGAGVSNMVSDHGQNDIPGFNGNYFCQSIYEDWSPYWDRSPIAHVRKVVTPTLILHGEKDERVTQAQAQELYRGLKAVGVATEFVTYPREGHSIGEREHQLDLMRRVLGWFERYLGD